MITNENKSYESRQLGLICRYVNTHAHMITAWVFWSLVAIRHPTIVSNTSYFSIRGGGKGGSNRPSMTRKGEREQHLRKAHQIERASAGNIVDWEHQITHDNRRTGDRVVTCYGIARDFLKGPQQGCQANAVQLL